MNFFGRKILKSLNTAAAFSASLAILSACGNPLGGSAQSSFTTPGYDPGLQVGASTVSPSNSSITAATSNLIANGVKTTQITIVLKDAQKNPIPFEIPTFSATDTGSKNVYGVCSKTDVTGTSTCTLSSTKAEIKTLKVLTPSPFNGDQVTFINGAATAVLFTQQPTGNVGPGFNLPTHPIVQIVDAFQNVVTTGVDSTATVSLALNTGAGTLGGTTSKIATAGIADFTGGTLSVSQQGSNDIITATKLTTAASGGVGAVSTDSLPFNIYSSAPGPFTISSTTSASGQVTIAWNAAVNANSYTLKYGTATGTYGTIVSSNATSPTTITGLTNGTPYYFMVTAANVTGTTDATSEASATPIGNFTLSSVSAGNTQAQIAWNGATGASSYSIAYGTTSGTYSTTISNQTSPATLTGLTDGVKYYFKIIANAAGSTVSTSESSFTPVSAFTFASVTAANGQAILNWNGSTAATAYTVKYGTSSGSYGTTFGSTASTTATVTGLSNNTAYYFQVIATNANNGMVGTTSEISATPIAPFTISSATSGASQVSLSWASASGASSYVVKYGTTSGTYGSSIAATTSTSATVTGLTAGTPYYFTVTATNTNNGSINATSESSARPLGAFTISAVSQSGPGQGEVTWNTSSGASTYTLKYGTSSGSYGTTVSSSATSPTTVTGLTPGTTYYFMVTAVNSSGSLNATAEASFTPVSAPGTAVTLTVAPANAKVDLSWTTSTGTGITYSILRGTTSGGPYTTLQSGLTTTTYSDTGLTNGTTYYYVIRATNTGGNADSFEVDAKPIAPFTLSSVAASSAGGILLSWNAAAGAESYTVKYGTATGVYGTTSSTTTSTSATITGLTGGTHYYFQVIATNSTAASLASTNELDAIPMGAFSIASASATSGQTVLTFGSSAGATAYTVKYGTATGVYGTTVTAAATSPYTVPGLANGTTYYFMVSATNTIGSINANAEITATPVAVPTTPSTVLATASDNSVNLMWTPSTGTAPFTYNVLRSTTSGSGYAAVTTGLSNNYFTDSSTANNTTYYYIITASNPGGTSNSSTEIAAKPISTFLMSSVVGGASQATVTWAAASGASDYAIKYGTVSGTYTTTVTSQTSPATITGLNPGTQYYFIVEATNASNGLTDATNELSTTPLSTFTITSLTQTGGGQAQIAWNSATSANSYSVKYGTTSGTYSTTVTGQNSPATITGLTAGTTYYFMVTATNANYGTVDGSPEKSITPYDVPTAPSSLTAVAGTSSVVMNWTASTGSGTISYNVLRSASSGTGYSTVGTTSSTTYTDATAVDNTLYYYAIQANNVAGNSTNSNEVTAIPIDSFNITSVSGGIGKAVLTWPATSGATGYSISYGTTAGTYTTTLTSQSSVATVTGLTGGTLYYFRVIAVNANNGSVASSNELSTTIQSAVNYSWTFDAGTDAQYSFDPAKIELVSGIARLKNQTPGDSSNSSTSGFAAGTSSGLVWNSANSKLTIDTNVLNSGGELNNTWTPQYSNIVGYWKLNGTANASINQGTVIPATIGTDGVFINSSASTYPTTGIVPGKQNQAITFDGSTTAINLGNPTNLPTGTASRTMCSWLNTNTITGVHVAAGYGSAVANQAFSFAQNGALLYLTYFTVSGGNFTSNVPVNTWVHACATFNGTIATLYYNGNKVSSSTPSSTLATTLSNFYLGQHLNSTYHWSGAIDEFAIWNSALSDSEIKAIYERQNANYTGTILSRVFDAGASSSWTGLSWLTSLPFGKELPPNATSESQSSYSALPTGGTLTSGLQAFWHLDEKSGTTMTDSSSNGYNGTYTNSPTLGDVGALNTGITFTGTNTASNQYVVVASTATNLNITGALTVSAWVKPTAISGYVNIIREGLGTDERYGLNISPTKQLLYGYYNGTTFVGVTTAANVVSVGTLQHVVMTRAADGVTIVFYVNGVQVGTGVATTAPPSTGTPALNIAALGSAQQFVGTLDEIGVWNRVLTTTEVTQLYQLNSGLMLGNIGLWHLNETSGTTATDSSGSGNTGTYTGTVTLGQPGVFNNAPIFDGSTGYMLSNSFNPGALSQMTLSAWAKNTKNIPSTTAGIIYKLSPSMEIFGTTNGAIQVGIADGTAYHTALTSPIYTDWDKWHLYTATYDGANVTLYRDGLAVASAAETGNIPASVGGIRLGLQSASSAVFWNGAIDEAGIWTRALSASEIASLYQRGSNRVKFQLRVCTTATCSEDPTGLNFKGPDGTKATYFTEAYNTATQSTSPSGNVLLSSPTMLFTNFFGNLAAQYYQYKAILESDVAPSAFSPNLTAVSTGPARFDGSSPKIIPVDAPSYLSLTGFSAALGTNLCSSTAHYQLSRDKTTWYYYNSGWVSAGTAGYANANDATTINTNISTFATTIGTGKLYVQAYLPSTTSSACEIDSITVNGGDTNPTTTTNPQAFQITSVTGGNGQLTVNWAASTNATSYTVCYGTTQALANACGTSVSAGTGTSATITGLTNNTPYYVNVTATDSSGTTTTTPSIGNPNSVTPQAPPTSPTSLAAVSGLSNVNLTWTASTGSGAMTYNILRSTTSGSGYTTLASNATSTTFTDLTALNGTQYFYVVSANNSGGTSANSSEVTATPLGAFTATVTATNGQVTLTWGSSLGATAGAYRISYGTTSPGSYSYVLNNQTSPVTITGLTNNVAHYFMITATNSTGSANAISEVSATPVGAFTVSSTVSNGANSATLTWGSATGATSYDIKYGTTSGTYTGTASSQTSPATVTGLTGGQTYYFVVKAYNANNGSITSTESSTFVQVGVNYTWSWPTGSDTANSFDSSKIEIASNVLRLKNQTPGDYDNSSLGFAGGTASGLVYDTSALKLKLDTNTTNSSGELNGGWAPQYSKLLGYWKLNGTAGSSITNGTIVPATIGTDGIFKNSNASILPTTGFVSAKQNQGILFDGFDDNIDLGNVSTYDFGTTTSYSAQAWFNSTTVSGSAVRVFGNGYGSYSNGFAILYTNGKIGFGSGSSGGTISNAVSFISTASYSDGNWHHVLLSVDQTAKTIRMYVDGNLAAITNQACGTLSSNVITYSSCSVNANHPNRTNIGSTAGTASYFNGSIDEVAVWNTALSAIEARTIYEHQNANYTGTILSRVMDAGASSNWQALSWLSTIPFGKELTPNATSELQSSYPSLPYGGTLSSGLVGFWSLDEKTGTTAYDSSGNSYQGTYATGITLGVPGALNTAMNINSTVQAMSVPSTATQLNIPGAVSVSAWINPVAGASRQIILREGVSTNERFSLYINATNALYYEHYTGSAFDHYQTPNGVITPGVLQHVALTRATDGKTLIFYVNGVQVDTTVMSTTSNSGGSPNLSVGGSQYLGTIDEVGVWNRTLTSSEITQLAQKNSGIMLGNIGLWHFNETSGTTAADVSGAGNSGTYNGTYTLGAAGKFNTAVKFDGTSGYVSTASVNPSFNTFTVSGWVKNATGDFTAKAGFVSKYPSFDLFPGANSSMILWMTDGTAWHQALVSPIYHDWDQWHHVAVVYNGTNAIMYRDGVQVATAAESGATVTASGSYRIGLNTDGVSFLNGSADEVGVWSRALSTSEITSIYQRGANRAKFQLRVCTAATCSDDPNGANFKGPDGTTATYFTEAYNMATQSTSPSGNILLTSPTMLFTNFFGNLTAQYYQYKAILESDVAPSTFSPDLVSVTAGPPRYDGSSPQVIPIDGPSYLSLSGFSATLGASCAASGSVRYQISRDKVSWYYLNSTTWQTGTSGYASSSSVSGINGNISSFPTQVGTGKLYIKALLPSDTTTPCELSSVTVTGGATSATNSANPNAFQVTSVTTAPSQITVNWNAATNATAYTVCYGTTQALANACGTSVSAGTSTSATISSLTNGTPYYVTVVATDASGSTYSSPTSVTTLTSATPLATPSAPSSLVATGGLSNVNLTWAAATGTGTITYSVLRSITSGSGYTTLASGLSSLAFTDFTALNGTTYYYVVNAINSGGTSANTAEVNATPIGTFTATAVSNQAATVTLSWTAATGATAANYTVAYGTTSGGSYTTTLTAQTSPITISSLSNGSAYYFLVTANNSNGKANAISEVSATPISTYTIAASNTTVGSAVITWSATTGATAYAIKYGTTSGTYTTTLSNQSSPLTISGLTGGTTYYFQGVATNTNNGTYSTAEVSTTIQQSMTYTWPFNLGTDTSYSFDSSKIELATAGGVARLKNQTPGDYSNSITNGFAAGTEKGVIYDSTNSKLVLDTATINSNGELNNSWAPQYSNIIGYWKLNGSNNSAITDGTIIPATIGGDGVFQNSDNSTFPTTGFIAAKQSQGIQFDGANDYIRTTGSAATSLANKTFTISAWESTLASAAIFSKGGYASTGFALFASQLLIKDSLNNQAASAPFPAAASDGNWHHLVAVVTTDTTTSANNKIVLYFDGVKQNATVTRSGNPYADNTTDSFWIGARSANGTPNNLFPGKIDEVAIWNGALTDSDVKTLYERQNANYTGTILSRVFDAGVSTSWSALNWVSSLPFGKELPNSGSSELQTSYPSMTQGNLSSGLQALWHFDEKSGTVATDSSGNGYNGAYNNAPTLGATGALNTAATFTGANGTTNQYVQVPNTATGLNNQTAVTVAAWINPTAAPPDTIGHIIRVGTGTDTRYALSVTNNYALIYTFYNTAGTGYNISTNANVVTPGVLQHVAVTRAADGVTITFYVNGAQVGAAQVATSTASTTGTPYSAIGAAGNASHQFIGTIDELGIWNRTLASTEIAQLYQLNSGLMTGIQALYHFNETTGLSFADSSGNSRNATATASPSYSTNGEFGNAIAFTAGNSITVPTSVNPYAGDFTISTWAYPYTTNFNQAESIIMGSGVYNTNGFRFGLSGSNNWYYSSQEQGGTVTVTGSAVSYNQWQHVLVTYTSATSTTKLYVNGVLRATSTGTFVAPAGGLQLNNFGSWKFYGMIDETGVWNRALTPAEAISLYQRGGNRVKYQLRVCTAVDCSDDPSNANFKGPDGSAATYFTEAYNTVTQSTTPTGGVNLTSPTMLFTNFFGNLTSQYFQYKAILESDITPVTLSPDIKTVSAGPAKYDATSPSILPVDGPAYLGLTGFTETLGVSCAGVPHYQLSRNKTTWYYYNSGWVNASSGGYANASTATVVNTNISAFPGVAGTGNLYVQAFLPSTSSVPCEIDSLAVAGNTTTPASTANPGAFQISSVTDGNGQVTVAWNAASGASTYVVCYGTTQALANACGTMTGSTSLTNTTISSLTNGTPYYFTVVATDASGSTTSSATTGTNLNAATPFATPSAPQTLAATGGLSNVALSWATPATVSGTITYSVLRSTTSGSGYSSLVSGLSGLSFVDFTALAGTTYYYVVTASNAGGASAYATQVSAKSIGSFTATAVASGGQVVITIGTAPTGASTSGYVVKYGTTSGSYTSTPLTAQTSPITVTGLSNGTNYYFLVTATNAVGTGASANAISELPVNPIGSFTNSVAGSASTPNQITVTFGAATGASSYTVQYGTTTSMTATPLTGQSSPATISGLTAGQTYYVRVLATNAANGSTLANTQVSTIPFMAAPSAFAGTNGNAQSVLTWTAPPGTGSTTFKISRSTTSGGPYTLVYSPANGVTSQTDTGLTNGTTYYYVIAAVNASQTTANSAEITVNPVVAAGAPTSLTATASPSQQVTLSWVVPSTGTTPFTYNVLRSTSSGSGYVSIATAVSGLSYTDSTGLTNGTPYYYVVQAANKGSTGSYSNEATATPDFIPALSYDFTKGHLYPVTGTQQLTFSHADTAFAPMTMGVDGLLRYESHNLLTYSEQIDNAAWTKQNATITANTVNGPDGNLTADKLVEDNTTNFHSITRGNVTATAGVAYTASIFVKAAERTAVRVQLSGATLWPSSSNPTVDVNLNTCLVTSSSNATATSATAIGASGWCRISVSQTMSVSGSTGLNIQMYNAAALSYLGDNASGMYLWGGQFEQASSLGGYVAATSAGTYGGPRFDYDPVTHASKGILIEEGRTNTTAYSEDLSQWSFGAAAGSANVAVAPDGNTTADLIKDDTSTGYHNAYRSSTKPATAALWTVSMYVKAAGRTQFDLIFADNTETNKAVTHFNLSAATAGTPTMAGTWTGGTSTIQALGNSWYRISVTATTSTETSIKSDIYLFSGATSSYTGDNASGIYVWGMQTEAGISASSYIQNTGNTTNARAPDVVSLAVGTWYTGVTERNLALSFIFSAPVVSVQNILRTTTSGSGYSRIRATSGNPIGVQSFDTTGAILMNFGTTISAPTFGTTYNAMMRLTPGNLNAFGTSITTHSDVNATPLVPTTLYFGSANGTGEFLNGNIRTFRFFGEAVPDADGTRLNP